MRTVNMHEAKTHLSRLVDRAAKGESFIIAKAGKPLVKVVPLDAPPARQIKRLGFMPDLRVPDDFDTMCQDEIEKMFYGEDEGA
ncbi:MAG TPA: type II toxin-antitoxin system prevent-host-death family antitoxin [Stellaceae bacterium]|jgi:prevent-host-death family protein|nr:type II toxin-antitoxin system prevent-host-death family antitoxin [Stellaceae bacterium]